MLSTPCQLPTSNTAPWGLLQGKTNSGSARPGTDPHTQIRQSDITQSPGSPQIVELAAVVRVLQCWDTPINIVTDSAYVANLVQRIENSCLKDVNNPLLYSLMHTLLRLLNNCKTSYFIVHIRAHTALPGPLVEGNRRADALTLAAQVVPNIFEQARLSHAFFHQNARAIQNQFSLSRRQAKDIIATCPECQRTPSLQQPVVSTLGDSPPQNYGNLTSLTSLHLEH